MELWIRTQKRDNLIKVDWLKMEETPDGYGYKEYYIYYRNERLLGIYKSKERALEVLDEIQNIIKIKFALQFDKETAFNGIPEKDINYLLHQCAVFDMPEE